MYMRFEKFGVILSVSEGPFRLRKTVGISIPVLAQNDIKLGRFTEEWKGTLLKYSLCTNDSQCAKQGFTLLGRRARVLLHTAGAIADGDRTFTN